MGTPLFTVNERFFFTVLYLPVSEGVKVAGYPWLDTVGTMEGLSHVHPDGSLILANV